MIGNGTVAQIEAMIEQAVVGRLDILHNNAAATHLAATQDLNVQDTDPSVWEKTLRINLTGTMLSIKYALPHLVSTNDASIVNTSSGASLAGDIGHTAYAVSQAGINALTLYAAALDRLGYVIATTLISFVPRRRTCRTAPNGQMAAPSATEQEYQRMFARNRRAEVVSPPLWFTAALDQQPDHFDVEVRGCRIHMRAWGDAELPPLVLVHGGAGHSGWWDHIAPLLSRTHRVIAPDLSGHGDSDRREVYDLDTWAQELLAAPAAAGSSERPKIVGHSLGGWVTATAARNYGKQIDSILVIDSPLRERAPEEARLRDRKPRATGYPSRKDIIARFRVVPAQAVMLPYIADHIAGESVHKTSAGWTWKFDPAIFAGSWDPETPTEQELLEDMIAEMPCRFGYLHCEAGVVPPAMADQVRSIIQLRGPFIELAQAGHHPMLDQPLPLVATLRTLLEFWSIT